MSEDSKDEKMRKLVMNSAYGHDEDCHCNACFAVRNIDRMFPSPGKLSEEMLSEEVTLNARFANANRSEETFGSESLAMNLRESVRRFSDAQQLDSVFPIGTVIKAYLEFPEPDVRFQDLFIKDADDHWHQTSNEDCLTWIELVDCLSNDQVVAYDLAVDWFSVWTRS